MRAKQYMSRAFRLDYKINCKLKELTYLKDRSQRATSSLTARSYSGTSRRSLMECSVVDIIDLEHEIDHLIDVLVELKQELQTVIEKLTIEVYRFILTQRYIEFKTWEEIANKLNMTFLEVIQHHGYALLRIEEELEQDTGGGGDDKIRIVSAVLSKS